MVAQDDRLVLAQGVADALALLDVEHHAGVVVEQGVVAVERARVLGQRVEQATQRREGLAVDRVGVGRGLHVGAGGVDLGVDGEGGGVDRVSPSTTSPWWLTRMRSDALIRLKSMANGLTQKWSGRSGSRAVMWPATPFAEAELAEQPEGGGQALLEVLAVVLDVVEGGHRVGDGLGHGRDLLDRRRPARGQLVAVYDAGATSPVPAGEAGRSPALSRSRRSGLTSGWDPASRNAPGRVALDAPSWKTGQSLRPSPQSPHAARLLGSRARGFPGPDPPERNPT